MVNNQTVKLSVRDLANTLSYCNSCKKVYQGQKQAEECCMETK